MILLINKNGPYLKFNINYLCHDLYYSIVVYIFLIFAILKINDLLIFFLFLFYLLFYFSYKYFIHIKFIKTNWKIKWYEIILIFITMYTFMNNINFSRFFLYKLKKLTIRKIKHFNIILIQLNWVLYRSLMRISFIYYYFFLILIL